MQSLISKLDEIDYPKTEKLSEGFSGTVESFWSDFIERRLPDRDTMLLWHSTLMEYVRQPDAMFAIRGYNSDPKKDYDNLRRGFLSKTSEGYSFFYTDNFHAAYYAKMAMDGFVPDVREMISAYNAKKFPSRFGMNTANERKMMAIPGGKDPGIQKSGYKIAHIINVGTGYYGEGTEQTLSGLIRTYFDGGKRSDWHTATDDSGTYYVRDFNVLPDARRYLVAEFLRFIHPFNYFFTPKKNCSYSPFCKDIAEYKPLLDFVRNRYAEMYGDAYNEFLDMIMVDRSSFCNSSGNTEIKLSYGLEMPERMSSATVQHIKNVTHADNAKTVPTFEREISYTGDVQIKMVREYLLNPETSFRKLEKVFLGLDSPARGGGFVAKRIINSYGIIAADKGIMSGERSDEISLHRIKEITDALKKQGIELI